MPREKQDLHDSKRNYDSLLSLFKAHKNINKENQKLILEYLKDARLGMHGGQSSVGYRKLGRYLTFLKQWETINNHTPFLKGKKSKKVNLAREDYRDLVSQLIENKVRKQNGNVYADSTKHSMLTTLNSFLKWLDNKGHTLTFIPQVRQKQHTTNPVTIDKNLWLDVANACKTFEERTAIITMFDAGLRPAELLNLSLEDVSFKTNKAGVQVAYITVNFSKTFAREISVPIATKLLRDWVKKHHPDKDEKGHPLFYIKYDGLRYAFHQATKAVCKRSFDLYTCRRSSISYYGNKLTDQQLAVRYGQVSGSKSLRRYVNRDAIKANEHIEKDWTEDTIGKLKQELAKAEELDATNQARIKNMEVQVEQISKFVKQHFREGKK